MQHTPPLWAWYKHPSAKHNFFPISSTSFTSQLLICRWCFSFPIEEMLSSSQNLKTLIYHQKKYQQRSRRRFEVQLCYQMSISCASPFSGGGLVCLLHQLMKSDGGQIILMRSVCYRASLCLRWFAWLIRYLTFCWCIATCCCCADADIPLMAAAAYAIHPCHAICCCWWWWICIWWCCCSFTGWWYNIWHAWECGCCNIWCRWMTTMLHAPCVVDFPSLSSTSFIPSLPYPDDHLSDGWSDEQFLFVAARQKCPLAYSVFLTNNSQCKGRASKSFWWICAPATVFNDSLGSIERGNVLFSVRQILASAWFHRYSRDTPLVLM